MPGIYPLAKQYGLSAEHWAFAAELANSGDIDAAARKAGVSPGYGYRLVRLAPIQAALAAEVRRKLAVGGALGVRVLLELAEKGQSERVRADCAKALVDRAGFVAPKAAAASNGIDKTLNDMSIDELKDLAAKLEDELSGRAKVINAPPSPEDASQLVELLD